MGVEILTNSLNNIKKKHIKNKKEIMNRVEGDRDIQKG